MPRGQFQIVLLAVALLFVNVWCVTQCSVAPIPCCPKHHETVKPCASSVVVEAAKTIPASPLGIVAMAPAIEISTAASRTPEPPERVISPPPSFVSTPIRA